MIRKRYQDAKKYWRVDKPDFIVWLLSSLATIFVDVTYGLLISAAVCLLVVVIRTQKQNVSFKENNKENMKKDLEILGDRVLEWNAPLNYTVGFKSFLFHVFNRLNRLRFSYDF